MFAAGQAHRREPLLAAGGRQPGRGGDEDQHRGQHGQRHDGQDEVDADRLDSRVGRHVVQALAVHPGIESAGHRRGDRRHPHAALCARQLRGGVPDDDDQRVRRRQRGVADHPGQAAGVAAGQLVRRGGAQQRGQRRGGVVLARARVTGDARRHRRRRTGGGHVEPVDVLPVEGVTAGLPPQRGDARRRRARGHGRGAGPMPCVAVVPGGDRVGRGHSGQQQADAQGDRGGQDDQPGDGLAAAGEHQPQSEPDHGLAPVSVPALPSRTMTSRSA